MTSKEAHARRADLLEQARKADEAYFSASSIRVRLSRREPDRIAAYRDHARGVGDHERGLVDAEEAYAKWKDDLEKANLREQGALEAKRIVEDELTRLLREEFEHFAPEAERKTKLAREEMERFAKAYAAAQSKWEEAAREWQPLAKAVGVPGAPAFPVRASADTWVAEPRPAQIVPDMAR